MKYLIHTDVYSGITPDPMELTIDGGRVTLEIGDEEWSSDGFSPGLGQNDLTVAQSAYELVCNRFEALYSHHEAGTYGLHFEAQS